MEITLNISKKLLILKDWMPQKVFQDSQNYLTRNVTLKVSDIEDVTEDHILDLLGTEDLHEFKTTSSQDAKDAIKKMTRDKMIRKKMEGDISVADNSVAERIKVKGMIVWSDEEGDIDEFLDEMHMKDYQQIVDQIGTIEDDEEDRSKE